MCLAFFHPSSFFLFLYFHHSSILSILLLPFLSFLHSSLSFLPLSQSVSSLTILLFLPLPFILHSIHPSMSIFPPLLLSGFYLTFTSCHINLFRDQEDSPTILTKNTSQIFLVALLSATSRKASLYPRVYIDL